MAVNRNLDWTTMMGGPAQGSAAKAIRKDLDIEEIPEQFLPSAEVEPPKAAVIQEPPVLVKQARDTAAEIKRFILVGVSLFTSASCAITSVYFSNEWFNDSQPKLIAMIMSITIVATLTVAPEFARAMFRRKHYLSAVIVILIAGVAMLFSMSSTIGGVYNKRSEAIMASYSSPEDAAVESSRMAAANEEAILKQRQARLVSTIEADKETLQEYQDQISMAIAAGENPETRKNTVLASNRNTTQGRITTNETELSRIESRLIELSATVSELAQASGQTVRKDFNAWLGGQLGMSADRTEFIMAIFPAIFIDVIAPTMLSVAFSL